jgi:uncharacterized repeat protein (TIGR01451 family)
VDDERRRLDLGRPAPPANICSLSGLGTQTASCSGVSGTVGAYVLGARFPASASNATVTAVESDYSGDYGTTTSSQGFAFAVSLATVNLTTNFPARVNASDQITVSATRVDGTSAASATTAGAATSASTSIGYVAPNDALTISETGAGSPTANLAQYQTSIACTNATSGSSTVLPSGSGQSFMFTPAINDQISCTFTNVIADLAVTSADNGPWTIGQSGAHYTITPSNTGSKATSSTITVTDTLPTGLTLSGTPTGTGWNCSGSSGANVSCTSSTVIAASASGAAITVPVSIGASTPVGNNAISNVANIYGGGDLVHPNAGSAAASPADQTSILGIPTVAVAKSDNGPWTIGQSGALHHHPEQ